MERITSRSNPTVRFLRSLGADAGLRAAEGLMLCRGKKLLGEALGAGLAVDTVVFAGDAAPEAGGAKLISVPADLLDYISKGEPELLFSCRIPESRGAVGSAVVLEEVQDPGNVGTVIRTAAAFGVDTAILVGATADPYGPKALRAAMGAAFRINIVRTDLSGLAGVLEENGLTLLAAVLSEDASDIRTLERAPRMALAVGNEGHGLSDGLTALCRKKIIIPMRESAESLNAAAAAAVALWELFGKEL
jgi:TrmH family RNA methyltransferase